MAQSKSFWKRFVDSQIFWPLVALGLIMLFNAFFTPNFFKLEIKDGHLFGSLIDIINRGAPLMILAIGMTMVIATEGVDLSVGAVVAISAAVATVLINPALGQQLIASDKLVENVTATPLPVVILAALLVSALCGLWNGLLVSRGNIQPMVATLVLMVAGRGIAQLITGGQIITVYFTPYFFIGNGYLAGVPFTLFLVAVVGIFTWLLTRKTVTGKPTALPSNRWTQTMISSGRSMPASRLSNSLPRSRATTTSWRVFLAFWAWRMRPDTTPNWPCLETTDRHSICGLSRG